MEFKTLQEKTYEVMQNYGKRFDIDVDEDYALIKLYEEVGEFAQATLIHRKKSRPAKHVDEETSKQKVAEELADILGLLIVNAKLLDIDLEDALERKWLKYIKE